MKPNNKKIDTSIISVVDLDEITNLISGTGLLVDSLLYTINTVGTPADLDAARELISEQIHHAVDKLTAMQAALQSAPSCATAKE